MAQFFFFFSNSLSLFPSPPPSPCILQTLKGLELPKRVNCSSRTPLLLLPLVSASVECNQVDAGQFLIQLTSKCIWVCCRRRPKVIKEEEEVRVAINLYISVVNCVQRHRVATRIVDIGSMWPSSSSFAGYIKSTRIECKFPRNVAAAGEWR